MRGSETMHSVPVPPKAPYSVSASDPVGFPAFEVMRIECGEKVCRVGIGLTLSNGGDQPLGRRQLFRISDQFQIVPLV